MSSTIERFECGKCRRHPPVVDVFGQQIKRTYDGMTVCVSCLTDLKLKNNDY